MTTNLDWLSAASHLTRLEVACVYHSNDMSETSPAEQDAERALCQQLATLVHLRTLVLVDFAGDFGALLGVSTLRMYTKMICMLTTMNPKLQAYAFVL